MKRINTETIKKAVKLLCLQANYFLPEDVFKALNSLKEVETSPLARKLAEDILENAYLACDTQRPLCQDTGLTVVFIEIGQDVLLEGAPLNDSINEGVKEAYTEGFLRKSIVDDPLFKRVNTKSNTPAVIHTSIVQGDKIKLIVAPKGGGSENMSAVKMLKPAEGVQGVVDFVVETLIKAGSNPCPPVVVGVGIGGSMEYAALLSKKALLNKITPVEELEQLAKNDDKASLELQILKEIQKTGIGAQGLGGSQTALGVNVEMFPCHIASLPVAVNINCHAARHSEFILDENTIIPDLPDCEFKIPSVNKTSIENNIKKIILPLDDEKINSLNSGDSVLLTGYIYTGRDAAHKKLIETIKNNQPLPFELKNQVIYYVGPCPAKDNEVIGPAGPTTSGRMDAYTPVLLDLGLKGMIGKGFRSADVIDSMIENNAVYFVATGGAAILIAKSIKSAEIIAYEELGAEAIYRLYVENFPVTVAIDSKGNNFYKTGPESFAG